MKGEAATRTCENCSQPVLQTDTRCWHCGTKLKQLEPETGFDGEQPHAEEEAAGEGPSLQILFYAAMTAVTALALLLVIRSLGQQPRLSARFVLDDDSVMELTAPDGSFSIDVPPGLVWYFPQSKRGQGTAAAQMVNDPLFEAALQPLLDLASDEQMLLLAQAESGFLAVARSEQLGQLTVENVVGSLANEPFPGGAVLSTSAGSNRAGSQLAMITLEQEDPPLRCRQYFLPNSAGAYLAAICAGPGQFEQQSAEFETILNSLAIR